MVPPTGFLPLPIIPSTHTGSLPLLTGDLLGRTMHGHPGGADQVQGDGFPRGGNMVSEDPRAGPVPLPPSCVP